MNNEEPFDQIVDREAHGKATAEDYEILRSNIPLWETSLKVLHQKVLSNISYYNAIIQHETDKKKVSEYTRKKLKANSFASYVNERLSLVHLMRVEEQKEINKENFKIKRKNIFQGYRIALEDIKWMLDQGYTFDETYNEMKQFLESLYASWDKDIFPYEKTKERDLFKMQHARKRKEP